MALEIGKTVGLPEKVPGIGAMMAHQAKQGCAVAYPVILTDTGGFASASTPKVPFNVLGHRTVDMGKNMRGRVV